MSKKVKIIIISILMFVVLLISVGFYFYSVWDMKQKKLANLKVKNPVAFEKREMDLLKNEVMILREIVNEKNQIQNLENLKPTPVQIIIKDEFSGVLISLLSLEKKLYSGGDIKNEVIKIRAFSGKITEIYAIAKDIEELQKLTSKDELLNQFADYVRAIKQIEVSKQEGKFDKILGIIAKYIVILDVNKKQDEVLLEAEKALQSGDFYRAFKLANSVKPKELEESVFLINLEFSAKIQDAIDTIHFIITQKL
jgi:dimeric dUTPase (all-alpha-NTP-PPase superfamily)